jgi:anti-sigma B factor antagonist
MMIHAQSPAGAGSAGNSPAPLSANPRRLRTVPAPRVIGQLGLSERTANGFQVISVSGELDIATAEQAFAYLSDALDRDGSPVSVDLAGVTFCDASGLGVLARVAKLAREKGRQLRLTAARPSLLKIMRITGLDKAFPELSAPALAV